ncbi:SPOC domain-like protein [Auricularia subglabra TFB-10046 SS5]|nr:SPOC domain-like protein [Auricularia subglabra TFB-10046 SS5]
MPAERAGFTVTMFVVDVSPSMGKTRSVELEDGLTGQTRVVEMTNLEWALRYVKLKIQEMIFHGRKTDQCGVILFGTEGAPTADCCETGNIVNEAHGGYDHVIEFIEIAQPNATTLAKLSEISSTVIEDDDAFSADPIDAIIVAIETQEQALSTKRSWTRKMIVITDAEAPMELEEWEATVSKINDYGVRTLIVGVDFDDEEFGVQEENKSTIKRENEKFWKEQFVPKLETGIVATCAEVLQDCDKPDIKETKSAALSTVLRIGDPEGHPDEAVEITVRTAKATAVTRPPTMKKFAKREPKDEDKDEDKDKMDVDEVKKEEEEPENDIYVELKASTEYYAKKVKDEEGEKKDVEDAADGELDQVDKQETVNVLKYGASWVDEPEGGFEGLATRKGIDLYGVFPEFKFRRDWAMGEVTYVWPDARSGRHQAALSSLVRSMSEKQVYGYCRLISRDNSSPKMCVLRPENVNGVDCFLMVQMPFSNDVRSFGFESLTRLYSKKGTQITQHPLLPTDEQLTAMEAFVDSMDLMRAEKTEEGRVPWFDPVQSYNPAVHRVKQALFHAAVVPDLSSHPLPPPHPDLLYYLEMPEKVREKAKPALKECKKAFNVKPAAPKAVVKRKQDHLEGADIDMDELGLGPTLKKSRSAEALDVKTDKPQNGDESVTEDEDEELPVAATRKNGNGLQEPTPARSPSPPPVRIIGNEYPLRDFRKNVKRRGDIISDLVEEFGQVILEIVMANFASRRHDEMIECLKEYRNLALKEDEIDAWNAFMPKLKEHCTQQERPNNKTFWKLVVAEGRPLSLISDEEASVAGGSSEVSEEEAVEFLQS